MIRENEFTLKHIAGYFHLSYGRVRGIIRDLKINPKRYEGNQPIYTEAHIVRIEKRNTKPGPKGKRK